MKKAINLAHVRTGFQKEVMERIKKDKVCPFCMKHFLKYHTKPIIKTGKHWILTENFQPYEGSRHHLMAVTKRHVTHFEKLSKEAYAELFSLFAAELKKRKVKGGSMFMRFGETDYTGSSVAHLHAQLISGVTRTKAKKPIITYLGYAG